MSIRIEAGPEVQLRNCEHCGRDFEAIHGFVYWADTPHAVYHAVLFERHPDNRVELALSLGEWTEASGQSNNFRVALELWTEDDDIRLHIKDPAMFPYGDSETFGKFLPREQALRSPNKQEWFHVVEHIVREDTRIAQLFGTDQS